MVVAEDLFKLCDPEMGPPIVAIKKAVLQWAGQEQAGSVQLLAFLEGNVGRWREVLRDAGGLIRLIWLAGWLDASERVAAARG